MHACSKVVNGAPRLEAHQLAFKYLKARRNLGARGTSLGARRKAHAVGAFFIFLTLHHAITNFSSVGEEVTIDIFYCFVWGLFFQTIINWQTITNFSHPSVGVGPYFGFDVDRLHLVMMMLMWIWSWAMMGI